MRKKFPILGKRIPENLYRKIHKVLPLICTDVVVVGGQRKKFFLLVKRKNKPEKGKWWFPGGRIYKNELLKDAAVRKVREETGLKALKIKQLGIYEYFSQVGYFKGTNSHMLAVVHLAHVNIHNKVIIDWQSSGSKWESKINPKWHPYIKTFLRKAGFV